MNSQPTFSLCHTTRRIPGWETAARAWIEAADNPGAVEYILSVDDQESYGKAVGGLLSLGWIDLDSHIVINTGRRCSVDGWNAAAAASTGKFLITIADDWRPIPHWDTWLLEVLGVRSMSLTGMDACRLDTEAVIWVNAGQTRDLMPFALLTRKYYERYGYIFYPEYESMFCDDDFTAQAIKDGVVIDCRKTLPLFEHLHPVHGTAPMDEVYARTNRPEAYEAGQRIYMRRHGASIHHSIPNGKLDGIGPQETAAETLSAPSGDEPRRRIAVCLPGGSFPKEYVRHWTNTLVYLVKQNWVVTPIWGETSIVFVTRQSMADSVIELPEDHEYVLWMDRDQIVSAEVVNRLISFLDQFKGVDMVAGWTYIQDELTGETKTSAGKYSADGKWVLSIPVAEMHRLVKQGIPLEIEWTGFPVVLMRREAIVKAAANAKQRNGVANPFAPIPAEYSHWGFTGEDVSFCVNVKDAGGRIFLDPVSYVPHLKLRAVSPLPDPANVTPEVVRQDKPEQEDLGSIIGRIHISNGENRVRRALRRAAELISK